MGQPSSIDKLPPEVKETISRLRQRGRTIDEILDALNELDLPEVPSRSALGRHVQKMSKVGERIRLAQDAAEGLMSRFGEESDDKVSRLNVQLMHGLLFETLTSLSAADDENNPEGGPVVLDAKTAKGLSEALRNLANTQATDANRILKIRETAKREAAKAVDEVAATGERGLTADTVELIKQRILGIGR